MQLGGTGVGGLLKEAAGILAASTKHRLADKHTRTTRHRYHAR